MNSPLQLFLFLNVALSLQWSNPAESAIDSQSRQQSSRWWNLQSAERQLYHARKYCSQHVLSSRMQKNKSLSDRKIFCQHSKSKREILEHGREWERVNDLHTVDNRNETLRRDFINLNRNGMFTKTSNERLWRWESIFSDVLLWKVRAAWDQDLCVDQSILVARRQFVY